MKKSKNSISDALSTLASLKPTQPPQKSESTAAATPTNEKIFPEPKVERVSLFLLDEDLKHIDQFIAAAQASGRRKVNQSQAIRSLIRTGSLNIATLDKVLAEDGRKKAK